VGAVKVIDRQDVGMLEARDQARFTLEALHRRWIAEAALNDLYRHVAVHAVLARAVNGGHAASADLF